MSAAPVDLANLRKTFGDSVAVAGLSLSVREGELVALLGPSGCGKTTTLRMVAGFVTPSAGTIRIGGRDITRVPPHRRDIGMVFQSYALFPHLTVADNIAFGLRRRGVAAAEVAERVARTIAMLRLDGLGARLPRQLSGGQQQRVAVGRALIINPSVLLLDEPFSNLDAQLRESTRDELRKLQRSVGITTIFVTHDQAEALAMADRVAIMRAGHLEQLGTPQDIYNRPASRFVAGFVGRSNLFEGRVRAASRPACVLETAEGLVLRSEDGVGGADAVTALVRPESIEVIPGQAAPSENACAGRVLGVTFGGATRLVEIAVDARHIFAETPVGGAVALGVGDAVTARWRAVDVVICERGAPL